MNRQDFLKYMEGKDPVSVDEIKDLEEVTDLFPWFQGGRILLAKALNLTGNIKFDEALKDAALHAGSRTRLFDILDIAKDGDLPPDSRPTVQDIPGHNDLNDTYNDLSIPAQPLVQETGSEGLSSGAAQAIEDPGMSILDPQIGEEEEVSQELPQGIQIHKDEVSIALPADPEVKEPGIVENGRSFLDWLKNTNPGKSAARKGDADLPAKDEIIEKFIQAEPRIPKPEKQEFFSPVNMAKKSIEDREDIVSETLASVFAAQGEVRRAIRIYEKLSLLNPEKNAYFAALIEKLENP